MAKDSWTDPDRITLLHHVHDGKLTVDDAADLLLCGTPDDMRTQIGAAAT